MNNKSKASFYSFIEYKKVAFEEPIQFCHTPLICEGEGPEECKTVHESVCETRYHEHEVEDDVVECKTIQVKSLSLLFALFNFLMLFSIHNDFWLILQLT